MPSEEPETVQSPPDDMPAWQRERRERIVRAALELLETGDYHTIQVRDVAERSGFALGTLYRYFNSKEHLYAAVMVEWARSFERNLRRQPLSGDAPERLKQVAQRVIRAFERRPQFLRVEFVLENSVDPHARAEYGKVSDRNLAGFFEAVEGIPKDVATMIVMTVTNVLATQLSQYAVGHATIEEVEWSAAGVVDLIFSPPPTTARSEERLSSGR